MKETVWFALGIVFVLFILWVHECITAGWQPKEDATDNINFDGVDAAEYERRERELQEITGGEGKG